MDELTLIDPPEPTDFDDEPTAPYWPAMVDVTRVAPRTWHVAQDPLKLTRVW